MPAPWNVLVTTYGVTRGFLLPIVNLNGHFCQKPISLKPVFSSDYHFKMRHSHFVKLYYILKLYIARGVPIISIEYIYYIL